MPKQLNNDFFGLLHLSFLKKIIMENPDEYIQTCSLIGKEIGMRIADDFCSRHFIMAKIKKSEIEQYIKLFFKTYFEKNIEINNDAFNLKENFEEFNGLILFDTILNEVFQFICDDITIKINNQGNGFIISDQ